MAHSCSPQRRLAAGRPGQRTGRSRAGARLCCRGAASANPRPGDRRHQSRGRRDAHRARHLRDVRCPLLQPPVVHRRGRQSCQGKPSPTAWLSRSVTAVPGGLRPSRACISSASAAAAPRPAGRPARPPASSRPWSCTWTEPECCTSSGWRTSLPPPSCCAPPTCLMSAPRAGRRRCARQRRPARWRARTAHAPRARIHAAHPRSVAPRPARAAHHPRRANSSPNVYHGGLRQSAQQWVVSHPGRSVTTRSSS